MSSGQTLGFSGKGYMVKFKYFDVSVNIDRVILLGAYSCILYDSRRFNMLQIKSIKFAFVILSAIFVAGCSPPESAIPQSSAQPTEPPFSNEEPGRYQTFIVQTMADEADKFFVARDGDKWRIDSAYGTPGQTATLHTDKDYILAFIAKAYSEMETAHGFDERPNMVQEISHGLLNSREQASYEKIDSANSLTNYRYKDAKAKEVVLTFDEAKRVPVKKEIFGIVGGTRTLEKGITLEGFTTEVDPGHFKIPEDFKKVSAAEMKKILTAK